MIIKHSKYKNTGILFELLVRQITADTLSGAESPAINILKKYFAERAVENKSFNEKIFSDIRSEKNPVEASLSKIKSPTLIIWGDTDRVIHVSSTEVFQKNIKNSKVIILKDCGHSPQIERPEEVASHILQFVSSIQP